MVRTKGPGGRGKTGQGRRWRTKTKTGKTRRKRKDPRTGLIRFRSYFAQAVYTYSYVGVLTGP
eukprot:3855567-Pyramimonas_sp.AAC.1